MNADGQRPTPRPLDGEDLELFELLRGPASGRGDADSCVAPLSFAQERFWFLQQFEPDSNAYNAPLAFRLHGPLDTPRLERALSTLVRRHDALRSRCAVIGEEVMQEIRPAEDVLLSKIDFGGLPEPQRGAAVDEALADMIREPLDLTHAPLLRAAVLRHSVNEHTLLVLLHHFVVDGWAVRLLCAELGALYAADGDERAAGLAPAASYARLAALQRAPENEAELQRHLDFWTRHLQGMPRHVALPLDRPRRAGRSQRGRIVEFELDDALARELRALARREGVTLFVLLLSAFKVLLHAYSGQQDVVVGTAVSSRTQPGAESVIGTFWNTLPLRTDLSGNPSFRELLHRAQRTTAQALAHQGLPFEKMVDGLKLERDLETNPLVQAMFVMHDTSPERALVLSGLEVVHCHVDPGWSMLDLSLTASAAGERLRFELEYRSELFESSTIDGLQRDLISVLRALACEPERSLSQLADTAVSATPVDETARRHYRAFLIGEGALLTECAQRLLDRGHGILGIASSGGLAADWCRRNGIAHFDADTDLHRILAGREFDLFFSIANTRILPPRLLSLPRCLAINYHPAPLPRYAGGHPLTWALINGEERHAVTWHAMTEQVDAGDILAQEEFDIGGERSTWLLAARAHQYALSSFDRLLDGLERGFLQARAQDLGERSYYSMRQRPPAACVLDLHGSGLALQHLVNGLDHGPLPNPVGAAKIAAGGAYYCVRTAAFKAARRTGRPGTVTATEDGRVTIAVGGGTLALGGVATLDGRPLGAPELSQTFPRGRLLDAPHGDLFAHLSTLHRRAATHEAYWRSRLAELQPARVPAPAPLNPSALTRIELSAAMRSASAAPHDFVETCLGALAFLIARLHGHCEHDIGWFDAAVARSLGDAADLFETVLPLRLRIHGDEPFSAAAQSAAGAILDARRRGPYLRDVLTRYPELRGLMGGPVRDTLSIVAVRGSSEMLPRVAAALTVILHDDDSTVTWLADPAQLDAETVRGLFAAYHRLLEAVAEHPALSVADTPLLDPATRRQVLYDWNDTRSEDRHERLVHEQFCEQARRQPAHAALICGGRQMSYAELERRSARLAARLQASGIEAGDRVAVYLDRSIESVTTWLAVLRSGAAVLALDPAHPPERAALVIEDAEPKIIIARPGAIDWLAALHLPAIDPDDADSPADADADLHPVHTTRDTPAYIVYTSGSTGRPKGVVVAHGALSNRLPWESELYDWSSADRVIHYMPPAVDFAVWEFLGPLASGATVVVSPAGAAEDPSALIETLRSERVTIFGVVPSLLSALLDFGGLESCNALRIVSAGGEVLAHKLVARFRAASGARLLNTYGPTEACVDVAAAPCPPADGAAVVPVGRPMRNTQLYVLDRWMEPLPPGILGEVYIGGRALATGYLNRPELTAQRFVPDPHSGEFGGRLYRTGDVGFHLPDGALAILGRTDEQVKVRGNRVELGEISATLNRHARVQTAVVRLRDRGSGPGQFLAAYVVPAPARGDEDLAPELRAYLGSQLPGYMCPDEYVVVDQLPLTPSGKIDYDRLPDPQRDNGHDSAPPRSALEQSVANAWSKVLGLDHVGVHDDFFALGGHSLLALGLVAELGRALGSPPPLKALFEHPTVAGMADAIQQLDGISHWHHLVPMNTSGSRTPIFFVPGGRGGEAEIMFLYAKLARELGPDQPFYGLHVPIGEHGNDRPNAAEQLAAGFVAEIRRAQPSGPYLVGGDCIGGLLAYEVAQQLRDAGEGVRLLALFETMPPLPGTGRALERLYLRRFFGRELRYAMRLIQRAARHLHRMATMNPLSWPGYMGGRFRDGRRMVAEHRAGRTTLNHARRHQRMLFDYTPLPYDGAIALFIARPRTEDAARRAWSGLATGNVDVYCMEGDHRSYVREDIPATARLLRAALDGIKARATGRP